jgi:hypothetical protein
MFDPPTSSHSPFAREALDLGLGQAGQLMVVAGALLALRLWSLAALVWTMAFLQALGAGIGYLRLVRSGDARAREPLGRSLGLAGMLALGPPALVALLELGATVHAAV